MDPSDLITSPVWQSLPGNIYHQEPLYENQHHQCQQQTCQRVNEHQVFVGMGIGLGIVLLLCFLPKIAEKLFR
jgi:hypothetical protein